MRKSQARGGQIGQMRPERRAGAKVPVESDSMCGRESFGGLRDYEEVFRDMKRCRAVLGGGNNCILHLLL